MLRKLYIKNFALIEELEASFGPGLNVMTGETGAGKSIVVGALKLILGGRSSTELVRTGEKKAIVEGTFDVGHADRLNAELNEAGLDSGPTLIVRREITRDQSRAFVNDSPVKLDMLRSLTANLADLHGQHDHQSILRRETHLPLLDGFGEYRDVSEGYRETYRRLRDVQDQKADLLARRYDLARQEELAEFQIAEIDAVGPQPNEEQALQDELMVLDNIEQLIEGAQAAFQELYGNEASIYDRVSLVLRQLDYLQKFESRFEPFVRDLKDSSAVISDVATFMRDYGTDVDFDPARVTEVRERLGAFEMLKRKYGGSIEAVMQHRAEIGSVYETATTFDESIRRLDAEIAVAAPELNRRAVELSRSRHKAAGDLEQAVVEELSSLGMADAQFVVSLEKQEDSEGWILSDSGQRFRAFEDGMDVGEFHLSANRGEPPKPLVKVASGGEASRIMLALKTILARSDQVPTLVFDEIDRGISGAVAERVGRAMHKLSGRHQVIAITHLPQIAAAADAHYLVRKQVDSDRTTTSILALDAEERAREIAVLLSGSEISSAALESARELIGNQR